MPDSSDNYQLPSWPPTSINRDLWNAVMGSIGDRLRAREMLEADFEALIAQGTQASLDYIQATVAPQIASLQTSIELAQEQIDQIIVDGIAPNAAKLGGQLPAYYAPASALPLKADVTYVDNELVDLATAIQLLLDQKAGATETTNALANRLRFDAAQSRTEPEKAQARENIGFTPALVAYNRWKTIADQEFGGVAQFIRTNLVDFRTLRFEGDFRATTVAQDLLMRLSVDNGATWLAGTNYYFSQMNYDATTVSGSAVIGSAMCLVTPSTTVAGAGAEFQHKLGNFNKALTKTMTGSQTLVTSTPANAISLMGNRAYGAPLQNPCNAFQIFPGAGSALNGYIYIEGLPG